MGGDTLFDFLKHEDHRIARRRVEKVRTILDAPRARQTDPLTSQAAAKSVTPGRTERLVLTLLYWHDCTADELCELAPTVHPPTLKSAISRLKNAGLIEDTGVTRLSDRGRQSIVWTRKELP